MPSYIPPSTALIPSTSVIGRIAPGFVADKIGRFNVMIIICGISAIFTLCIWIPGKSNAAIIVYSVLYGISSGSFVSVAPSLIAQISEIRDIGLRTGTAFAVQSFGSLTGSPIAGAIAAREDGNFLGLQLFCGVSMVASTIVYVIARWKLAGFQFVKV